MNTNFYKVNRLHLADRLNGGIIVATAYTQLQRSNDMAHQFEQESNFWYLCGIEEPDWQLIIDGTQQKSWLIMPEIDEVHQIFDGSLHPDEAKKISGVDKVLTNNEGQSLLRQLAKKHTIVYTVGQPPYADHFNFTLNPALKLLNRKLERIFSTVQVCNKELATLRAIKQPEEITALKQAIKITIGAFGSIHQRINEYKFEYEIEVDFTHYFRNQGVKGHAYDPIVAAGMNACTLHYGKNNDKIRKQQCILMDVGARADGYCADITRTYVKGEPTKRQLAIHSALEQAHQQVISLLDPNLLVEQYQRMVTKYIVEALRKLDLVESDEEAALRRYFPHAISHGLGIDVHDSLGAPRYFEPNMVLTVEPGIYIPEEKIGMRIEDDILITDKGHVNLSAGLSTGL